MSGGIKELKLWQEAVALAGDVVRIARPASKRETKALTDRTILVAGDVPTRVAAAYTHPELAEQRALYLAARRSLVETETLLAVGRHAGLLSTDAVLPVSARAGAVHRLLSGYLAYVDRQIAEGGAAGRAAPAAPDRAPGAGDAPSTSDATAA